MTDEILKLIARRVLACQSEDHPREELELSDVWALATARLHALDDGEIDAIESAFDYVFHFASDPNDGHIAQDIADILQAIVNRHRTLDVSTTTPPTVEQVEAAVGMGAGAWDTVDPKEIIRAVLRLSHLRAPSGSPI